MENLNQKPTISGTLIVQDGEYLIINDHHRALASTEQIGLVALCKTPRGFQSDLGDKPEYELITATPSFLKHVLERNFGTIKIYSDENGIPLLHNNKIIIA